MKQLIVTINDSGMIIDKNGNNTAMDTSSWSFDEYVKPSQEDDNVVRLVGLGITPDDLIKLKASGLL